MVSEKKLHRSLRELLKGSVPLSPVRATANESNLHSGEGAHSHRFFLRSRDTKGSNLPQSSSSSLKSLNGNLSGGESFPVTPTVSSSQLQYDSESSVSHLSVAHHEHKSKSKRKSSKKEGRHESHLLLKRFFKILHLKDHISDLPKSKSACDLPSLNLKLAEKYEIGRLIGTGASGSVNLVHEKNNPSHIYALKKFRSKLKNENEQDYLRKVRNEYLVGEHLRHQNLIHTLELFEEKLDSSPSPDYYIVMEYCPFDFFNLVMSGLMKYDEICCYFKQIANGVHHLHEAGIAHRDLKLDNCVVAKNGVLKLIDFGSAFQFKKLIDKGHASTSQDIMLDDTHKLLLAKGILGSDPYLAPEVFVPKFEGGYDARLADVWSIAIIFCCMILKRFPWKLPTADDPSYRAYACINSKNEPLSQHEMVESMTSDLSVGKDTVPRYGPERLLRILPPPSRNLIALMLKIDTEERVFIEDVVNDQFFRSIEYCHFVQNQNAGPKFQIGDEEYKVSDTQDDHSLTPSKSTGEELGKSSLEVPSQVVFDAVENHSVFVKAKNHKHHLVTEKELQKIHAEKERVKRAKEAGIA